MSLTPSHKLIYNVLGRNGSINKNEVLVFNSTLCKCFGLILGVVQSDDFGDVQMLKYVDIASSRVAIAPFFSRDFINGTHEGQELTRDDPVEVAIFDLLIVLVLFDIEGVVIIPPMVDCERKSFNAVLNSTFVEAFTFTGVPIVS